MIAGCCATMCICIWWWSSGSDQMIIISVQRSLCQWCPSADTSAGREWLIHASWLDWNLFSLAVSGNIGWAENHNIATPPAAGNTPRINKYIQCQLYALMALIARQTDRRCMVMPGVWNLLCRLSKWSVIWCKINNTDYYVASDVASWANILKSHNSSHLLYNHESLWILIKSCLPC